MKSNCRRISQKRWTSLSVFRVSEPPLIELGVKDATVRNWDLESTSSKRIDQNATPERLVPKRQLQMKIRPEDASYSRIYKNGELKEPPTAGKCTGYNSFIHYPHEKRRIDMKREPSLLFSVSYIYTWLRIHALSPSPYTQHGF